MPQNPNYIPAKDSLTGPWADNFSTLLTSAPTDYGLVAGDATAVAAVVTPWLAALAAATTPGTRTPVSVAAKDDARAAMEAVVRPFAVAISQNPSVSNELKTGIGVTARITTKTRNSVVGIPAEGTVANRGTGGVQFGVFNPDTPDSQARPLGALGWEIQIKIGAVIVFDYTVTRPAWFYNCAGLTGNEGEYRVRWVGALLPGGAANTGPWSPWNTFFFVPTE